MQDLHEEGKLFLPALPARGATRKGFQLLRIAERFLPALPARGATMINVTCDIVAHFYPRSPRGERLWRLSYSRQYFSFLPALPARGATTRLQSLTVCGTFLPALPARGATKEWGYIASYNGISTRAPREGSDVICPARRGKFALFLPALPARGATAFPLKK